MCNPSLSILKFEPAPHRIVDNFHSHDQIEFVLVLLNQVIAGTTGAKCIIGFGLERVPTLIALSSNDDDDDERVTRLLVSRPPPRSGGRVWRVARCEASTLGPPNNHVALEPDHDHEQTIPTWSFRYQFGARFTDKTLGCKIYTCHAFTVTLTTLTRKITLPLVSVPVALWLPHLFDLTRMR